MSNMEEAIARYSGAERQLCDEAGPLLGAIIRSVEARCGVRISELRVTVDWANGADHEVSANCTIVHAQDADASAHPKTTNGEGAPARA